ncbi:MAG: hypothetical protein HZT40_01855 [Candidatus Thiothrix singaporensis]|uniref:Uncharacterized protein n=1 Tax=Candidatus Thiothrix singaporensis TaxID=2799669 RepID=A0A7L6AN98_9GAMM|nr:MAG: hypothetical protein HZT40_01855 [Candidatus Thiothrix singaporensis]
MPPKFPLDEAKLRKLLLASKSTVVVAALSSGVAAAACPTFPEFGYYARNVMCSKIPAGTHVEVTRQPTHGSLVFTDYLKDGAADEIFYMSRGDNMPDSFGFTTTGAGGAITGAGDKVFSMDDLNGYGGL